MGAALALFALAFSALGAGSASAALAEWLCGSQVVPAFGNCFAMSENLELVQLEDMSAGAAVDCLPGAILDEGEFGPNGEDRTTAVTFTIGAEACFAPATALNLEELEVKNACETLEKLEVENLPWQTLLEKNAEGKFIDSIKGKAEKEEAAYVTTCKAGIFKITDLCEGAGLTGHPALVVLENLPETETIEGTAGILLVTVLFLEKPLEGEAEFGNCTVGGEHSALVSGEILWWALINNQPTSLDMN